MVHKLLFFFLLSVLSISASISPDWAKDVVWYQIFPERFNNGDLNNDPTRASLDYSEHVPTSWEVREWQSEWFERDEWEHEMSPHFHQTLQHRRYGGDLQGVIDRLDYLKALGINGIYFNPLFYANSLHKYDGRSFHHIDPYFGPDPQGDLALIAQETSSPKTWQWTAADKLFLKLLREAKARGIRVIIDGVWNHSGRDFFAFADIREKSRQSIYTSWYNIISFDDPGTAGNEFDYHAWHGFKSLPEFADNRSGDSLSPGPKYYIFKATQRWMDPNGDGDPSDGIDGWRLDVAEEVPDGFWQEWHAYIRKINPEVFTSAEIWGSAAGFLEDTRFASAMNYRGFAIPVKGWLIDESISATEFAGRLEYERESYDDDTAFVLQNLVDSHDTQRVASAIANRETWEYYKSDDWFDYDDGERVNARTPGYDNGPPDEDGRRIWKMVALFQATYVGAPMIYYGTELGMWSADDPEDRMPTWWHRKDDEIFTTYQKVLQLRHDRPALRRGHYRVLETRDDAQVFAFERSLKDERIVIIINRGKGDVNLNVDYLDGLQLLYATDPDVSSWRLPRLSAVVYGTR
ncbi:alpha-amylase [Coraliomargarita sinensis]|uniref:Alpha-amylase n=1 Tax=Coraliomargarita sinensis TaxID=2174842 RepID=A0A317ZHD7_9BACT|nr:glycoside hydrolase family 13 protein [Coraliomargarita sinensis]PXA04372.1 alpha-amylase [Coraliomargarita sinensis]